MEINDYTFQDRDGAQRTVHRHLGLGMPGSFLEAVGQEVLRLAERDGALTKLLEEVALALGCLPSTFPDANGHVVEKAKALAEENQALKAGSGAAAEALALAEEWDRCYPGNIDVESVVNQLVAALRAASARIRELEEQALAQFEHETEQGEELAAFAAHEAERAIAFSKLEAELARVQNILADQGRALFIHGQFDDGQIERAMRGHAAREQRVAALEAESEALKADLALAVRERPLPLSDGPPDFPLEREAFLAEEPEDQWLLYQEAAHWASVARGWELDVKRLESGWKCFHCDGWFGTVKEALEHFGSRERAEAVACVLETTHPLVIRLRNRVGDLEAEVERLKGAVQWMSAADDFSPGGEAHEGWVKLRDELFYS